MKVLKVLTSKEFLWYIGLFIVSLILISTQS